MVKKRLNEYEEDGYFVTIFDKGDNTKNIERFSLKENTILYVRFDAYLKFVLDLCDKYDMTLQKFCQFDAKDRSVGFYLLNLTNGDQIKLFYDGEQTGDLELLIESEKKEEIKEYILKEVNAEK